MKSTPAAKLSDFTAHRQWYLVDAQDCILGKLATVVADTLRGKTKAVFSPHVDCGDYVIIINAGKVKLTGAKREKKIYRRHSGYLGHLKEVVAKDVLDRQPKRVIQEAVAGMLPKNKLRKHFLEKMYIYAESEHKHAGQNPIPLKIK
ncbi:MAG: 50S ribosomal protein L13, large subunit ribosomal protein L13 [Candidatus Peregrinibacteria bacterium GW2011_GWE2_39_6]|nr:MAG: 50S ribosomal protein L13, large subunit ribosomal protein L13 [Candidatus Peregrinibacteria bacterium GW2011_GWF2_39_17]KKR26112.1 MAG: 50S ribosomal protein L13, large subunit ribosomal protein L13 [Candidatus Peregrinibacteria bacterium GW2011_GWE2_39_6]HCW32697.1 50S ribosomal protein L13 [Candidatus Peregrinibacteria bacterium]